MDSSGALQALANSSILLSSIMNELYIIEKDNKRRKAQYYTCGMCKAQFLGRLNAKNHRYKYCSQKCASDYKKLMTHESLICSWCGNNFTRSQSHLLKSKSKLYFCTRKCKDVAQKLGGIKEIMPPHFGTGTQSYREKFNTNNLECTRCGYKEFSCGVDIHHIDKDRSNNNIDNLIPLCACCHKALHCGLWKLEEILVRVAELAYARVLETRF